MRSLTLVLTDDGRAELDVVGELSPYELLSAGAHIITITLTAMTKTGIPTETTDRLGGDVCAIIGRIYRQGLEGGLRGL